jgi:peptide/nickel transport system permease protein
MTNTVTSQDPSVPALLTPGGTHGLVEDHTEEYAPVQARSYWQGVWLRLKRDKLAVAGGIVIPILFIVAFAGAPLAKHFLGHGPNDPFLSVVFDANGQQLPTGVDANGYPAGPLSTVYRMNLNGEVEKHFFLLGSDSTLGRDEFLRLLYGAQVSLEVGVGATLVSIVLGVLLGAAAGFYRGVTDTIISRVIEVIMAFPYLLFVIAIAGTVGPRLNKVTFGFLGEGVLTLVLVFGFLGWFYSARIFRSVALSLREKEFVEAARMVGSSNWRILRTHIFPHLVGPLIVLVTLNVAGFILAEAGLSFLGLGIALPTASWGTLLKDALLYHTVQPWLLIWPGLALLLTTLSFNLLGDGLRDAFDPKSTR